MIQKFCLSSFTYIALLEGHEGFQLSYFFIYCANKIKKTLHKASNEMIQVVSPRHCFNTFEKVFQLFCNWTTWFLLTIDPLINPSGRFKWGQAFSLLLFLVWYKPSINLPVSKSFPVTAIRLQWGRYDGNKTKQEVVVYNLMILFNETLTLVQEMKLYFTDFAEDVHHKWTKFR